MAEFICGRFIDQYLIAHRTKKIGVKIEKERFIELNERIQNSNEIAPDWLSDIFLKLGRPDMSGMNLNEALLIRNSPLNFGKASFEVTERCNYQCRHCYLGNKSSMELPLEKKKEVIDLIEKSGSLWLQITGGEPLLSKNFVETYSYAHSRGFLLVVSTNGSLCDSFEIKSVFSSLPPYRIAISLYGATAQSYEKLTRKVGSFAKTIAGLEWLSSQKIRTRLNIIVHKFNRAEIEKMVELANRFGFEYHVYSKISPTIDGNPMPLEMMIDECDVRKKTELKSGFQCMAGRTFFNVDAAGRAMICKIARQASVDLVAEGIKGLKRLPAIADNLLKPISKCESCDRKSSCNTCPPILSLYQSSKIMPSHICKNGNRFARKES